MRAVRLPHAADLESWRSQARALLTNDIPPEAVTWSIAESDDDLFDRAAEPPPPPPPGAPPFSVPRAFLDLSDSLIRHRDPVRLPLLYRLLWRQTHGERGLLALPVDPDVQRATIMTRQVRSAVHHMRAYLRFREVADDQGPILLAWFEPEHHVLELVAPFFSQRLGPLRWSILTPERSAHWDSKALHYGPGQSRPETPDEDALAACWKTYYASTFNPARVNPEAMARQMPRRYWKNLEETALIADMVRHAGERAQAMIDATPAAPSARVAPPRRETGKTADPSNAMDGLCGQISRCRDCPLWESATQAVPPEGPAAANGAALLMLVGDQPADQDDLGCRPFIGAAGKVLDKALAEAGLNRRSLHLTHALKHFTFAGDGQTRHARAPAAADLDACRHWLEDEIALLRPPLIVALGATAAKALLGMDVSVAKMRGQIIEGRDRRVLITWHPDAVWQQPDPASRAALAQHLAEDLTLARSIASPADPDQA